MTLAQELKEKTKIFHEVELEDLHELTNRMKVQDFEAGHILFNEGDIGDTMYIILQGEIRIFGYDQTGEQRTINVIHQNQIFGELSPIDQQPRSASAAAATPLKVLSLNRDDLLSFLDERPQFGIAMMRSLSQKVRDTTDYFERSKPVLATPEIDEETQRQELSRKAASQPLADILDAVDKRRESQPEIEVPKDLEMRPRMPSLFENMQKKEDAKQEPTLGIFDRITQEHNDDEEEEK